MTDYFEISQSIMKYIRENGSDNMGIYQLTHFVPLVVISLLAAPIINAINIYLIQSYCYDKKIETQQLSSYLRGAYFPLLANCIMYGAIRYITMAYIMPIPAYINAGAKDFVRIIFWRKSHTALLLPYSA